MAEYRTLLFERDGPISQITLNQPPANHTALELYSEVADAVAAVAADAEAKALVLTGAGSEAFCAGANPADFLTLDPAQAPRRNEMVRKAFWGLYDCPVPLVGAINGLAAGAGVAFAAACDILVAADHAAFMLQEIDLGLFGGFRHAARIFPPLVARRMFLTAEPVTAAEAYGYGAVTAVVPLAELLAAARRWALKLAAKDGYSLRQARACMNLVEYMALKPAYEREQEFTKAAVARPETRGLIQSVVAQGGTLALAKQRLQHR